jgi:hypothetical protein
MSPRVEQYTVAETAIGIALGAVFLGIFIFVVAAWL